MRESSERRESVGQACPPDLITLEIAAICLMTDVRPAELVPVVDEADLLDELYESRRLSDFLH